MPYNPDKDEYYWGKCFARDGSDYDPNYPSPRLSDASAVLSRHFPSGTSFHVVICGKVYKHKSDISGVPTTTDLDSIQVLSGVPGRSLEWKMSRLYGFGDDNIPQHVTGIFFRPLT